MQGKALTGATGLASAGAAGWTVARFAPWRQPDTPYWKFMPAPDASRSQVLSVFVLFTPGFWRH